MGPVSKPDLNKNVQYIFVFDSPVRSAQEEQSPDRDLDNDQLWVNWNNELVPSNEIDWRTELEKAKVGEGDPIDIDDYCDKQTPNRTSADVLDGECLSRILGVWLITPTEKLPRDMTRRKI